MRRLTPRLVGLLAVVLVGAAGGALASPAVAQSTGNDSSAVAVNNNDGSTVFKLAFKVSRAGGSVVDPTNAAVAVSSCSYCETVAVSLQVVLVTGDPSTFTPTNVALAYNQDCYECATLADAFQFVFGTGGAPVHLSAEGNRQLAVVRQEYQRLRQSGLPLDQLQTQINALAQTVYDVFSTQLVTPPGQADKQASASTTTPTSEPAPTTVTSTVPTTSEPTVSSTTPTSVAPTTTTTKVQSTTVSATP